jgi:dUTP pyrophosphatase
MQLKVIDTRLLDEKYSPSFATAGAAAIDLRACVRDPIVLHPGEQVKIPAGLAIHMEENIAGLIIPRSGLGTKGLVVGNLCGLIDPDYQGEISVTLWNRNSYAGFGLAHAESFTIQPMERIAQMLFVPFVRPVFDFVREFSTQTARGSGGHGSTGTL